jgi:hypothetical protein
MRVFRDRGCTVYDLAGVTEGGVTDEGGRRRDFFKKAFNPRIVRLVPSYCAALRPAEHALFFNAWRWYRRTPLKKFAGKLLKKR